MRKRLYSLGLCLAFVLQLFLQAPVIVSAADELKIKSPLESGYQITDKYLVKFSLSSAIAPKTIVVSYLDNNGAVASVPVEPIVSSAPSADYTKAIAGIGSGENTIKVDVETQTGEMFSDQRQVKVNPATTNIMMASVNVEPYTSDPNKFKNLLKANNTAAAREKGKAPKDNAFISRFVDILFEEAASEKVRPDIVFAQIMLETGWLGYIGTTVGESQNNFGGLGATGGGVRGNVFQSMRDGIRANVQHLVAYAAEGPLNNKLIDPRFNFITRGSAPVLEYLGMAENPKGLGWAGGAQYGYKILSVMSRLKGASAESFAPTAADTVIQEFEVLSVARGENPLNINLKEGYDVNQEVRLGVATSSDTEHRFTITNKTTGTSETTPWSDNKAVFYTPAQAGEYLFQTEVRAVGTTAAGTVKTKELTIGTVQTPPPSTTPGTQPSTTTPSTQPPVTSPPVDPDKEIAPVIGSVTLSSSPYFPGKKVSITIADASAATARVNEYQLEVEHGGVKRIISSWSVSRVYEYTPAQPGDHLIRVQSRNKLAGGAAVDSITNTIKVWPSNAPMDLIAAVSASDSTIYKNKAYQILVTPVANPGIAVQYQLISKGTSGDTILAGWTNSPVFPYTPEVTGAVTLQVRARNQAGDGTVLDTQDLKLNVQEMSIYSPPGYVPANPYQVKLTNTHIAGIKSAGHNLIFSAMSNQNQGLLYRFYVIDEQTGARALVQDWSTSTQANWRAVYGYRKLVVEVKHPNSKGYWDARQEVAFRIKNYPTVFLDAGHGGSDSGYVVRKNGVTYRESTLTLSMASLVRSKLQGRGINVITSRTWNQYVSLDNRVNKAVAKSSDLFITLHYTKSAYSSTKGVRTYYSGFKSNPLANLYLAEGREAAEFVGPAMASLYTFDRGISSDQEALGYNLRLLKNTTMPSIQLNLGYLSNSEDLSRIKSSWYRNLIAQRIADSIMTYLNSN